MRFTMVCSVCESSIGGCQRRGCMGRVLSARFSLELVTLFPFRQSFSLLLDRCPRHVSGRHKSSQEKWRSEVLAANCRNTSGSETHCRRARLLSLGERHSAGLRAASSLFAGLLAEET